MKKILLLTDFSETSKNAIRYALQLFKDELCTFYVLFVQDATAYTSDDIITSSSTSLYDSLINKHHKKLITYVEALKAEFETENFKFKTIVDFDSLVDAIIQTVKSKKIDLIVMGTNGATGAKEIVFGSNTLNVIRNVDCKTLIIPENFDYTPPKSMLLALDPVDTLDGKAVRNFFRFFDNHDINLHVLRMNSSDHLKNLEYDDKESLGHHLKDNNYIYNLIDDIPMENAVSTYLQTNAVDVLSLFVQKETLLERLFIGSSTTKINKNAEIPLLIFHS